VIILLTDGENTVSPDPLEAAQNAVDRGVRVYTVGVGSPEGAVLEVEGFTVHTQLDEAMLEQIANITGGAYFSAQSEEELQDVYQDIELQLVVKPDKTEITSLFAGISILIFLIGGAFSLLWFSRVP
jgi:Ca-activated chloride channel family protein